MKIYSVKDIIKYVTDLVAKDVILRNISVEGEVESVTYHSSGHVYLVIKDQVAKLRVTMFRGSVESGLRFRLEKGQKVVVTGRGNIYNSEIQLVASKIEQQGLGEYFLQLQRLKMRLGEEGIFDFEHKKPIPEYPRSIGIVSSQTAAGLEDFENEVKSRNPYVAMWLCKTLLQGAGAAESIVRSIQTVDRMGYDVMVIIRGGGPSGDMDVFDDERVVRAIYEADTPIITGVGHTRNWSLSDYAADEVAITPTATAQKAVKDLVQVLRKLRDMESLMASRMKNQYAMAYARYRQYSTELSRWMSNRLSSCNQRLHSLETRLLSLNPAMRYENQKKRLSESESRLRVLMQNKYADRKHRYEILATKLHGLSPTAKLVGGFGYVEVNDNALFNLDAVHVGDTMRVTVEKGVVTASVTKVTKKEKG